MVADRFSRERAEMVERQLRRRGISNERVLAAMALVPREEFVPPGLAGRAYEDGPLPIGYGQTISQPYMVALMTQLLDPQGGSRVLEVGCGSGYQAAVLAALGAEVFSVERVPELARQAAERLERLGYPVRVRVGDGTLGWPEEAPFDGIIVTAGAPEVPPSLLAQLADGGRLVIPVGPGAVQELVVVTRRGEEFDRRGVCSCMFVPLVGKEGHPEEEGMDWP